MNLCDADRIIIDNHLHISKEFLKVIKQRTKSSQVVSNDIRTANLGLAALLLL